MALDYRITEVLRVMEMLHNEYKKTGLARLEVSAVKAGLELSKRVCVQEKYVFATPLMKNLMVCLGDVKQVDNGDGTWSTEHLEVGKKSKAVEWMNDVVKKCLLKYNGPEVSGYDHSLPVSSAKLYDTDCWLGWKPEIWDIVPGQEKSLKENFPKYANARTNFSYEDMIKLIQTDLGLQKAILIQLESLPEVKASGKVLEVSDPFMQKKTGVSYPFYRNDATKVEGKGNLTYGELCIKMVEKAQAKDGVEGLKEIAYRNNVYSGYKRLQRGKARTLRAQSRITNLVVNMVNAPEMEAWKESALGTGFKDTEGLKADLIAMAQFVIDHPEYCVINKDFTSWDETVGYGWQCLQNALRYMRANGQLAKELIKIRHVCGTKAWFIDGPNGKAYPIYGRQMSGYDDTTLGNTTINNVLTNAGNMNVDPDYSKNVVYPMKLKNRENLGDDVVDIILKSKVDDWVKYVNSKGFVAHEDNKDAFGCMFLQYRVFQLDGKWVMGYNWPRVLRSMLSKETAKQLGKAGWTLSFYQQCGKLVEIPFALKIVVNICAALDKDHLMLDVPIEHIKKMVQDEDRERLENLKGSARDRALTTAERLNTNPQFSGSFKNYSMEHTSNSVLNWDYFGSIQESMRSVYDATFLPSLGFTNPDLSKVH